MDVEIRQAGLDDIPAMLEVKRATWPEEAANPARVADVLRDEGHATLVAVVDDRIAGFMDGFLTLSAEGVRRWEVDLLAVHPEHRNQGLASRLVAENTHTGFERGADVARALIRLDNAGSQHTFVRCGYICDENEHVLYVSSDAGRESGYLPSDVYLIPVSTLNYRGLWVEGVLSADSLRRAQRAQVEHGYDLVGAVIPISQREAVRSAVDAGFTLVGVYHWWTLKAGAAPARRRDRHSCERAG